MCAGLEQMVCVFCNVLRHCDIDKAAPESHRLSNRPPTAVLKRSWFSTWPELGVRLHNIQTRLAYADPNDRSHRGLSAVRTGTLRVRG